MIQQARSADVAPPAAAAQRVVVTSDGPVVGGAAAVYEGLRAQRNELSNQLEELEGTRRQIASQLEELEPSDKGREALEQRMTEVDKRIASVDGMLASNAAQIAQAAAVPGAIVEPPRIIRQGPPEEAFVLGGLFMIVAVLPISIAFARRIWRRSAAAVAALPRDLAERLARIEQGMEATSVEVERIGEGQRFLTRLFTEGEGARALGTGTAQRPAKAPERLP